VDCVETIGTYLQLQRRDAVQKLLYLLLERFDTSIVDSLRLHPRSFSGPLLALITKLRTLTSPKNTGTPDWLEQSAFTVNGLAFSGAPASYSVISASPGFGVVDTAHRYSTHRYSSGGTTVPLSLRAGERKERCDFARE
jgi:hypothetical protein